MPRVCRRMHERANRDDAAILADNAVDLAAYGKDEQLIGVVMKLRAGACSLVDEAEVHVFAFDDRTARARQVRRQEITFEVFEAVKRHALIPFSCLTVRPPLLTVES